MPVPAYAIGRPVNCGGCGKTFMAQETEPRNQHEVAMETFRRDLALANQSEPTPTPAPQPPATAAHHPAASGQQLVETLDMLAAVGFFISLCVAAGLFFTGSQKESGERVVLAICVAAGGFFQWMVTKVFCTLCNDVHALRQENRRILERLEISAPEK